VRRRGESGLGLGDAAGLLAALGGLVLWVSLTDSLYRYVRPSMRPWLVMSGAFVSVLALLVAVAAWRERHRGGSAPGRFHGAVGWALVVPVMILVSTDAGALGSFAVRQRAGAAPRTEFDLDVYLRTHTVAGQAPALGMAQFLSAADDPEDRALLAATTVRLTGFIVDGEGILRDDAPADRFVVARLMVGCCAGDATPLPVAVEGLDAEPPPEDTWVEVTGRFDPELSDPGEEGRSLGDMPVLVASDLREVDEPRQPYENP
jgi:uncharacterized repeat protein (TIGR03943 family)